MSCLISFQVSHPLCDRNSILARLDAVSEIADSMDLFKVSEAVPEINEEIPSGTLNRPKIGHLLSSVLTTLGRLPDLQRGITRIFYRTATSAEVKRLIIPAH